MSGQTFLAVVRALLLMGLGTAGMVQEMFLAPPPDMLLVGLYIAMILGEATLQARWLDGRLPPGQRRSSSPSPSSPSSEER